MSDEIERPDVVGATRRAETIRESMRGYVVGMDTIGEAYEKRDWVTLGHGSWDEYCEKEFGEKRLKLSREQREQAVLAFRGAGMSIRAIGSALGLPKSSVADVLAQVSEPGHLPDSVTGADGKTYAPTRDTSAEPEVAASPPEVAEAPGPVDTPPPAPAPVDVTGRVVGEGARPVTPAAEVWTADESVMREYLERGGTVVVSQRGQHDRLIRWAEHHGLFVRIDRRTEWGNPFEMPGDGDRGEVVANYAAHYILFKPSLLSKLDTLRGKALGCWCAPEKCHGDVLVELCESP